ncbi:hypothetical protein COB28_03190 [Candidatus Dependentiae bacterium]|nr:MAG: hypothetical protein COB28_03190 [Candidatus Dependentiae bacterium]
MQAKKTTFFIASGSGGHILPAQTYAKKQEFSANQIFFLTGGNSLERRLIPDGPDCIRYRSIQMPGKKIWKYPIFFYNTIFIFFKSLFLFKQTAGEKEIFTTGGILSIPIMLAAWMLRLKITLIELNAVPGKTTRFLSPLAQQVLTVFDLKTDDPRYKVIEYPLRIFKKANTFIKKESTSFTIALFGGSQGSRELNKFFLQWLEKNRYLFPSLIVYHFYGNDKHINFKQWYSDRKIRAETASWCNKPEEVYAVADLVFSRGGSGALHELLHFQKKTVILPLRSVADDHQYLNAKSMQKKDPHLFYLVSFSNDNSINSSPYNDLSLNLFISESKKDHP